MALERIGSNKETFAATGWTTFNCLVSITEDADLDLNELKRLLRRVEQTIQIQPDRVRYAMNGFVIAVGCFVKPLFESAVTTAEKIGVVSVDVGNTDCKVPFAPNYIRKVQKRGTVGKKRKNARC